MIEELYPSLYRIKVPLPRNPLKELNSYVFREGGRSLVIDTGMNREECLSALSAGLNELGVDLGRTDFFITHLHADHFGLVGLLASPASKVYMPAPDAAILRAEPHAWQDYARFAELNGFPEGEVQKAIQSHPGVKYSVKKLEELALSHLREGDVLSIAGYTLRCIETPGHTVGHECLYEAGQKFLIAGDHILGDITPNISLFNDDENPLREYLASLDKVYGLDVKMVLPGHRTAFTTFRERIDELKQHHLVRAEEVLGILRREDHQAAFSIAAKMTWDMVGPWDLFPVTQKWFATGEALAHLKYLEDEGRVVRAKRGDIFIYSLA